MSASSLSARAAKSLIPSLKSDGILPQNGRILLNLTAPSKHSAATELLMENELLYAKVDRPEADAMSGAPSISTRAPLRPSG